MDTSNRDGIARQKVGGAAALYLALGYIAAMPYFLLVVDYAGAKTAADKIALLTAHQSSMTAMYLASYVVFGLVLGVLVLALHDRLRAAAPATARAATAVGLLWSVALVTCGMIFNYGMASVVALAATDKPAAIAAWQAIEPVTQGLGGAGGELLGGLWVLLVSWVALRGRVLPVPLCWLGMVVGVAGVVSVAPPLRDAMYVFGLLQIVWFAWTGVTLLSTKSSAVVAEKAGRVGMAAAAVEG
jgi:hypothetical protein